MLLTIGMAHCNDFDGAYFTIQDIRKELSYNGLGDLLEEIEFLIVDNSIDKDNSHRDALIDFSRGLDNVNVISYDAVQGTSASRNAVIDNAQGEWVMVMDPHVLLCSSARVIMKTVDFIKENRGSKNLYSGPLVYDNLGTESSHFNSQWHSQMWGQWRTSWDCKCNQFRFSVEKSVPDTCDMHSTETDEFHNACPVCQTQISDISYYGHESMLSRNGFELSSDRQVPFPIFAQGLGLFLTKKSEWLGFNEHAKGFGGEECYIHEKYRKAGRQTLCLPFMKWLHRFQRPEGTKYPLSQRDRVRNYILEFAELRMDLKPVFTHFVRENDFPLNDWRELVEEIKLIYPNEPERVPPKGDITQPPVVVDNRYPFITCICPTYKRPGHLAAAVKSFEEQDYPEHRRELIILDDAGQINECSERSWRLVSRPNRVPNLWEKFNVMAGMARQGTDIIAVWEDDDIYLPWHLSSIAKSRTPGASQFFAPKFAYSNYEQNIGDVVKENCEGRFHATWAYSKELWDQVGGYDAVRSIGGDKVMREKCLKICGKPTQYENKNPTYVYRWARAEWHTSVILNLDNEQDFQDQWDYLGYRPVERVENFTPSFDEEASLIYQKFRPK